MTADTMLHMVHGIFPVISYIYTASTLYRKGNSQHLILLGRNESSAYRCAVNTDTVKHTHTCTDTCTHTHTHTQTHTHTHTHTEHIIVIMNVIKNFN